MRVDRTQQAAEAQQAQEARPQHGQHKGFAGGSHRGTTYRHAPRAQPPARRNTGPAPRPRARPQTAGRPAGHPDDEHPPLQPDDPRLMVDPLAGSQSRAVSAASSGQRSQQSDGRQEAATLTAPARTRMQPPAQGVQEGEALRRSRHPAAALLLSPRPPGGTSPESLCEAFAALYFRTQTATGATRLAAAAAVARHLPEGAEPMTMAQVRAALVAYCSANGPPPSATEAQRSANWLAPLALLRAMRGTPPEVRAAQVEPRNTLLQRALLPKSQESR